jgi:hypothetical protein
MKKIIIIGFLVINSIAGLSQLSITVDSLRQRSDTLWFTNRKGSIVYLRTKFDTLYFGDATGEKKVSQIGTGTGGVNWNDTLSKIATKYDISQSGGSTSDSAGYADTAGYALNIISPIPSITVGTGADTTRISSTGIITKSTSGEVIKIGETPGVIRIENNTLVYEVSSEAFSWNNGAGFHQDNGITFADGTYLNKGYSYTPESNTGVYVIVYDSEGDSLTYAPAPASETVDIEYRSVTTDKTITDSIKSSGTLLIDGDINIDKQITFTNTGANGIISIQDYLDVRHASTDLINIDATNKRITIQDILQIYPTASAPSSPQEGDIYYNSGTHTAYCWNGSSWNALW